jgi:hypothetical protein
MSVLSDQTEERIVFMMDFVKLVEEFELMEESVETHEEQVVHQQDEDELADDGAITGEIVEFETDATELCGNDQPKGKYESLIYEIDYDCLLLDLWPVRAFPWL